MVLTIKGMNAALKFSGVCFLSLAVVGCRHTANEASKQTQPMQILPIQPAITHNYSLEQKVTKAKLIIMARIASMSGSRLQNLELENQRMLWGKLEGTNTPILLVRPTTDFIYSQRRDANWIFFLSGDVGTRDSVDYYDLIGGGTDRDGMELATAETLERVTTLIKQLKK